MDCSLQILGSLLEPAMPGYVYVVQHALSLCLILPILIRTTQIDDIDDAVGAVASIAESGTIRAWMLCSMDTLASWTRDKPLLGRVLNTDQGSSAWMLWVCADVHDRGGEGGAVCPSIGVSVYPGIGAKKGP